MQEQNKSMFDAIKEVNEIAKMRGMEPIVDDATIAYTRFLDHTRSLGKSYVNNLIIGEKFVWVHKKLTLSYEGMRDALSEYDQKEIKCLVTAMKEESIVDMLYSELKPKTVKVIESLLADGVVPIARKMRK